jgi:DNA-binding transcriptional LysR family regulator
LIGLLPLSYARKLALQHRIAILPVPTDQLLARVSAHWRAEGTNPLTEVMANCLVEAGRAS